MALFPRVTTWVSNQVLTASALNGEFNNILNNAQLSSWVGFSATVSQMRQTTTPGPVGTESLASSGSDELQRLRYMLAYVLGTTQWYDQTGSNLGTNGIKRASLPVPNLIAATTSTGSFTTTSNSFVDVTNAVLTITTVGRPVFIGLQNDGSGNSTIYMDKIAGAGQYNINGQLSLYADNGGGYNLVAQQNMGGNVYIGTSAASLTYPASSFWYIDSPASGTWTYKLQAAADSTSTLGVSFCKLVAYEF